MEQLSAYFYHIMLILLSHLCEFTTPFLSSEIIFKIKYCFENIVIYLNEIKNNSGNKFVDATGHFLPTNATTVVAVFWSVFKYKNDYLPVCDL
jgi:hypothetical protein